ncbi:MAG: hypothetical protein ABR508_03290 [Candidatus Baltobacteraceae bacterium]
MRSLAGALCCALALTACGGTGGGTKMRLSKKHDIMMLQAVYAPVRNGTSGAPVDGLIVRGTIANKDTRPLACRGDSFVLTDRTGNGEAPSTAWCDAPAIGPHNASAFNVTFRTIPAPPLELRFQHGDGTYEARALDIREQ